MSPSSVPPVALEQILERITDISQRIQQLSSLDDIFNCAAIHGRALLRSDRTLVYQIAQTGQGVIRATSSANEDDLTPVNRLIDGFDGQEQRLNQYRQGQCCTIDDIHTYHALQPSDLDLFAQSQVRASLTVPILKHNQLWGFIITHHCHQPRTWHSVDIQLLEQIAFQLGIAIHQAEFQQLLSYRMDEESGEVEQLQQNNDLQHRAIVEDQTEMIARFSSDSTLLFVNDAYCRYFGINRDDILGKSYKPIIYEPDQDIVAQQLQQLNAENPTITVENRVINGQGEIRWTQWINRLLVDQSGHGAEIQTVGRDITELKQTELELRTVRDRLQYLLTYAPAVIFTCRSSGDYGTTYISSNITALLGYEPQDFTDSAEFWLDRIHPDDVDSLLASIPQVFVNNRHRHEYRFLHADGTYRWLSEEITVIRDEAGQPLELIGYLIDVSDRKAMQNALNHSEERFRIVQELSLDAFTILKSVRDREGNIIDFEWTYVNPRAAEILKHPISDLVGHRLLEVLPGNQENSELFRQYVQVVETGTPHDIELFYNAEGITGWFRNMTVKLEDGIAISFSDITRRKEMEKALLESTEQLQKAVVELEELNHTKDEFLSTVSHELRTPMTNIKMSIRMLELGLSNPPSPQRDEKVAQYLKILGKECDREVSLINDLLDLQQLEAGRKKTTLEPIHLHQWFAAFIHPFHDRATARQQQLEVELPPAQSPAILYDLKSLERIVGELLNNACKYTPPGQQIVVTTQLPPDQLHIQVTNFGVDIPAQALPHLFDRFYRVPSADPWQQGGTGLGLALVKKLVEYLNGTIHVDSGSGRTCFSLMLPIPNQEISELITQ